MDPSISNAIFAPGLLATAVDFPAELFVEVEDDDVALSRPESTKVTLFTGTSSASAIYRKFLSASN